MSQIIPKLKTIDLNLLDSTSSNKINLVNPGATYTLTLPAASGTTGDVLQLSNNSGTLEFAALVQDDTFSDATFAVTDSADATRRIIMDAGGTTNTSTTITAAQTANRTITLPDVSDTLVGVTASQTLLNKTLTAPTIATITNSGTITIPTGTDTLVARNTTDILTNKTLTAPTIATITNSGTVTIPAGTDTLVGVAAAQTLTNKILTAPTISTITNSGTITIPTGTDTLVARNTTDILTNKTLTAPTIATITNSGTITIPTGTDTLVARNTTDTLVNKTLTDLSISGSASAAAWGSNGIQSKIASATFTDTTSSGTVATNMVNAYSRPTLAASSPAVYTNASTVYIDGAPIAGTNATLPNPFSLYINSGNSYIGGSLSLQGNTITGNSTVINPKSSYTTTGQTLFTIPANSTSMTVKLWGSGGGSGPNAVSIGGAGGYATATLNVTPGDVYVLTVGVGGTSAAGGGSGTNNGAGAVGGNNTQAGGGGQYSALHRFTGTNYILIAAAGGGGGAGLNVDGGAGGSAAVGVQGAAGSNGIGGVGQSQFGVSGSNYAANATTTGTTAMNLNAGNGASPSAALGAGGGGGGYGGGASGWFNGTFIGGGGGGGSYAPPVAGAVTASAATGGTGQTPANTADPDYTGSFGRGGNAAGGAGGGGLAVVIFSALYNTISTTANLVAKNGAALVLNRTDDANGVSVYANAASDAYQLILPASQGAASTLLTNDGLGNLSWTANTTAFSDAAFSVTDATDATRRILMDAGGTTNTSTTIAAAQTANRTITLPDVSDTLVGVTASQTLLNKTLTAPTIATITNSGTVTIPTGTDTLVNLAGSQTLSNKILTAPTIATITNSGTVTIPTGTDTLVNLVGTQTLQNKTMTGATNTLTASLLKSATTEIAIAAAAAPTAGQVLTASSGTAATWQTPAAGGDVVLANNNAFTGLNTFASASRQLGGTGTIYNNTGNTESVTVNASATTASYSVTLPESQGTTNTFLRNDGSGALSWTSAPSTFLDTGFAVLNQEDTTEQLRFNVNGSTNTWTTILTVQTADRDITLPDATDTLVGRNTTDILTNKTLTDPEISTIKNGAATIYLPATSDTLVGIDTLDTLTNKTMTGTTNTLTASFLKSDTTEVAIVSTAPTAGQVLRATSDSAATWQTLTTGDAVLSAANAFLGLNTFASASRQLGGTGTIYNNTSNTQSVTVNASSASASYSVTLPPAQGAASTALLNNGSGALSWTAVAAIPAAITGSNLVIGSSIVAGSTQNTFIGISAGNAGNTADANLAIGNNVLTALTSGSRNVAIGGKNCATGLTAGVDNVIIGDAASVTSVTSRNVIIGSNSGSNSFSRNVAVGAYCFNGVSSSAFGNVCIGDASGTNLTGAATNNINIGYDTSTTGAVSNTCRIGNGITYIETTTDNACDLGTTTSRFKNVLSKGLILSGTAATNSITQQASAATTAYTVTWPAAVASSNGQVLSSTTGGVLSWATPTASSIFTHTAVDSLTYTTGTVEQTSTTVTGSGTTFSNDMVGGIIIYSTGARAFITAFVSTTSLTVAPAQTVTAGATFTIYYKAVQSTQGRIGSNLLMLQGATSGAVGLQAPNTPTTYTVTMPTAAPAGNNYFMAVTTGGVGSFLPAAYQVNVSNRSVYTRFHSPNITGADNFGAIYGNCASMTSGNNNSIIGGNSCFYLSTGSLNSVLGADNVTNAAAGTAHNYVVILGSSNFSRITGDNNLCLGNVSGNQLTSGTNNILIGNNAGNVNLTTGSNNIIIGNNADLAANGSNNFVIGSGVTSIVRNVDNACDLGSSTLAFKSVFLKGGVTRGVLQQTTTTITLTANNYFVEADATANAITITLPEAVNHNGREYVIVAKNNGVNSVTVTRSGSDNIVIAGANNTSTVIASGSAPVMLFAVGPANLWYLK